jgi:glycerol-3-phosphate acyltransferase PlsX
MRVALDALGGDNAPKATVEAALMAATENPDIEVMLVGDGSIVQSSLDAVGTLPDNLQFIHTEGFIEMDEEPVSALRKKPTSSIPACVTLLKEHKADAMVSAGNTGACVAASMFGLNRLPGVRRPGIAANLPTPNGPCTLIDVGANINCKPINLYQYAVMGTELSRAAGGGDNPSVGLLSIGEEAAKGNSLVKETRALMQEKGGINFQGNVEGSEIFRGSFDVVVCEGFVGNAVLKVSEGLAETMLRTVHAEVQAMLQSGEALAGADKLLSAALQRVKSKVDYGEAGGAPLVGLDGYVQICHGRSDARALANAVRVVAHTAAAGVNAHITEALHAKG